MALRSEDVARLGPRAQKQILAKLRLIEQGKAEKKQSKYHNVKDKRGKLTFASKDEARRFDELMLLLKAGQIRNLKLQPEFTITEAFTTPDGERVRAQRYRADFSYERCETVTLLSPSGSVEEYAEEWIKVVEDVKSAGTRTQIYKNKYKILADRGIYITEVFM